MLSCLELIGEIVAIHPLSPGTLTIDAPFNVSRSQASATLSGISLSLSAVHALPGFAVEGYYLYNNARADASTTQIIIENGASLKESSKTTAAGTCYTTKVSATSYHDIDAIKAFINEISSHEYFDCLVVDSLDNVFLLQGVEPATSISVSAALPITSKHGIDVEIVSVNGLIPIVFA